MLDHLCEGRYNRSMTKRRFRMTPIKLDRLLSDLTLEETAKRSRVPFERLSKAERGLLELDFRERMRVRRVVRAPAARSQEVRR